MLNKMVMSGLAGVSLASGDAHLRSGQKDAVPRLPQ